MTLFLPGLRQVELFVHESEQAKALQRASLSVKPKNPEGSCGKRLQDVKTFLKSFETMRDLHDNIQHQLDNAPDVHEFVEVEVRQGKRAPQAQLWLRFGKFFRPRDCKLPIDQVPDEVPFTCLALPLNRSCDGRAFVHLPLPIQTRLPVHVHADFALHDNRRGFWRHARDLDGQHLARAAWNEHILRIALPKVYADVLQFVMRVAVDAMPLPDVGPITPEFAFGFWPCADKPNQEFQAGRIKSGTYPRASGS